MKKIRFAIVGTNIITDRFIEGLKKVEGTELVAVYSRTVDRGTDFATMYQIPHVFTDLEEMAQSPLIDAVYIASPNALHAKQAILLMDHGKHVICEKAFASNVKEVDAMIQAAKKNQVFLMEAIKNVHVPNFKIIEENLKKIGTVRKYIASFCQYSSRYDAYRSGDVLNAFRPELSNGALVDIGVYCIAPMVRLFGKPEYIQATGFKLESGVDGEGNINFTYPTMSATIQYSKISNSNLPSEIQGEEGTICIEKISQCEKVSLYPRKGEKVGLSQQDTIDNLYDEIQDFVDMIRTNNIQQQDKWLEESRIVVEIMEEARKQMGIHYPADELV